MHETGVADQRAQFPPVGLPKVGGSGLKETLITCTSLPLGCPSEGPRSDPHGGETVPLPHLRHPLPPPADPEEPPAHSHRREAVHRESPIAF